MSFHLPEFDGIPFGVTNTNTKANAMILQQPEQGFVYFTKSVRIPRDKIIGIRRPQSGDGCIIETDRGIQTVIDDYDAVSAHLYGEADDAHA